MKLVLIALTVATIVGWLVGMGCAGTRVPLEIGKPAPGFTAPATGGATVSLAEIKGRWVVLYFYPKAGTPGCTQQACSLRDGYLQLQQEGIVILGISLDSVASQERFKAKHTLPFDLISDADKAIARAYGVLAPGGFVTRRETFLIDPEGNIAGILDKVDVKRHDAEVLDAVRRLKTRP